MARIFRATWPLIALLFLAVLFAFGLTRDPSVLPSEMIDRAMPEFELTDLYRPNVVYTQDLLLDDVALINVFGSWCIACEVEHPKLMALSRMGDVKLVGIDWRDTREKGQRWLRKNGDPYDLVIFDEDSRLAIDLGVTGAPESFLVDKEGRIRYKHVGIITDDVWSNILSPIINDLKAEE
jgi:cytochrome c biogenesis protein CcmG/thiol:disulfide interchange protein DsbE